MTMEGADMSLSQIRLARGSYLPRVARESGRSPAALPHCSPLPNAFVASLADLSAMTPGL